MSDKRFVFLDIETTGLDFELDDIIEVGIVVTDERLRPVASIETLVNTPGLLNSEGLPASGIDDFVLRMHHQSGLWKDLAESPLRNYNEVDTYLADWVETYAESDDAEFIPSLVGNTVHFDYYFMKKHFPLTMAYFTHRIIDISTIAVLAKQFKPSIQKDWEALSNETKHRAVSDCMDSIQQLLFYRWNGVI